MKWVQMRPSFLVLIVIFTLTFAPRLESSPVEATGGNSELRPSNLTTVKGDELGDPNAVPPTGKTSQRTRRDIILMMDPLGLSDRQAGAQCRRPLRSCYSNCPYMSTCSCFPDGTYQRYFCADLMGNLG